MGLQSSNKKYSLLSGFDPLGGILRATLDMFLYLFEDSVTRSRKQVEADAASRVQAVKVLREAVVETRIFLGSDGRVEDSPKLARAWKNASDEFQALCPELSDRCWVKAKAWAAVKQWSDDELRSSNATLDSLERTLGRLVKQINRRRQKA